MTSEKLMQFKRMSSTEQMKKMTLLEHGQLIERRHLRLQPISMAAYGKENRDDVKVLLENQKI